MHFYDAKRSFCSWKKFSSCFRGLKIQEFLVDYIIWGDDVLLIDSRGCENSEYVQSKKFDIETNWLPFVFTKLTRKLSK